MAGSGGQPSFSNPTADGEVAPAAVIGSTLIKLLRPIESGHSRSVKIGRQLIKADCMSSLRRIEGAILASTRTDSPIGY